VKRPRGGPNWHHNLTVAVPGAVIGLAEEVVTILSLGWWIPSWRMSYLFGITLRQHRKRVANAGSS
jgi:hypothetical protein